METKRRFDLQEEKRVGCIQGHLVPESRGRLWLKGEKGKNLISGPHTLKLRGHQEIGRGQA